MRSFSKWNVFYYLLPILMAIGAAYSCERLPKPDFSFLPRENVEAGDTIWFTNLSKEGHEFEWNFGDGSSTLDADPKHVYELPGIYEAKLTASNESGEGVVSYSIFVNDPTVLGFIIYDSTGTVVLENAAIWVYTNSVERDKLTTPVYSGTTNSQGTAEFHNVEPMVYHIWVVRQEANGFWAYKGFTSTLRQNRVNLFTVPCIWMEGAGATPGEPHQ